MIRHMPRILIGLLAPLFTVLAVSPAPLAADHDKLSLTPVSDLPLATVGLRHRLPDHPGPGDQGHLAPPPPPCDKDVDLAGTFGGVIAIAAQDNLICTSSDIDAYVGQDGKTYVVQAGGQEGAWVHTDVSNPSSPVRLAVLVWSGAAGGNTFTPDVKAFSQGTSDYIALALERLAPLAFCGVVIVEVTDPLNPIVVEQFIGGEWCDVHNVFVEDDATGDGRYLYLTADLPNDLRVLDIGDVNNIAEIGRYTHPEASNDNNVHDVTVIDHGGSIGRRVYVSYWDAGLMILDAADVTPGVVEAGSPNQPLNPDHSVDPAGFLTHHAYPSEDGTRVFIQDEFLSSAGQEPVQMWDIASPASPSYVDGISLGSALMPVVNPAHNLLVVGNRLYAGWYKAGLQAFDFNSAGFLGRPIYHQVQTEGGDDAYDGAWGVRLATIGTTTYVFQSDRRYGLIIDRVDLCSALANPGQSDTDGDGVINACDPDDDDDSLGLGNPLWLRDEIELFVGTDPLNPCADTATPDDEADDKLAVDLNDDQAVNVLDRARMVSQLLSLVYDQRFDLNGDGVLAIQDRAIEVLYVLNFQPLAGTCTSL